MKKYLYLISSLFLVTFFGYGQNQISEKGNKEYDQYSFINAREYYLRVANKGNASPELLQKLGDSYYYISDYESASKWYGLYLKSENNAPPEYLYRYALSLKSIKAYTESDVMMDKFYKIKGNDFRAAEFNAKRDYLKEIGLQSGRFTMEKVDFNDKYSDFAPSFYGDTLVFASNRVYRTFEKNVHTWNDQPFSDLYRVDKDKKEKVHFFSKDINSKYHESTAAFTKDGNTIYFTRNNYLNKVYAEDDNGLNRLKLYRGHKKNKKWVIEELPFNSNQYSVAHPSLSTDDKTLYFASDMPGGYGQSDLYKVAITGDTFGKIINLGKEINSEGRDTFPFMAPDNKLFFASDGHEGLGGLDVFVSQMNADGSFDPIFNLGEPINGQLDDFTFIINKAGEGYMASNRENSQNDEIYSLKQIKPLILKCTQYLKGVVLDSKTQMVIAGAHVKLLTENGEIIAETTSGLDGSYTFPDPLDCNKIYLVRSEKIYYIPVELVLTTGTVPEGIINQNILMQKGDFVTGTDLGQVLKLDPIYFNLDKWNIRKDAEIELQKVIDALQKFPDLKIDVRSHTDSRAPYKYNLSLSNKRNKATIQYIIKKGTIDPSRLSGRGYGESEPVNDCKDGVKCSEKEHQLNRRSEFIILQK
ncbi:OmpA family protein [Flavobacterium sp. FlaQc-50]|uniref:OmpA family protein n=1 Tax=unclassified Flavobacterium TaxID=196869 RepID=UPI003756D7ED